VSLNVDVHVGLGPLDGLPTHYSTTALSTTATKVTLPTVPAGREQGSCIKVKLVNGHATNVVAWTLVRKDASAPTITADYNATTGASVVLPGTAEIFVIPADKDLYVVASAASTSVNASSFLFLG
jgi:hypothetical protein